MICFVKVWARIILRQVSAVVNDVLDFLSMNCVTMEGGKLTQENKQLEERARVELRPDCEQGYGLAINLNLADEVLEKNLQGLNPESKP